MRLVVDANILFSALIKESKTSELLINPALNLYTPEFILAEFDKYRIYLANKSKRTEIEFDNIFIKLKQIITLIPLDKIKEQISLAKKICPDSDDIMYFAVAIKLNCPIWSNDKKLKEQDKIKIYSTDEILKLVRRQV